MFWSKTTIFVINVKIGGGNCSDGAALVEKVNTSVGCNDSIVYEPSTFNSKWYSHKSHVNMLPANEPGTEDKDYNSGKFLTPGKSEDGVSEIFSSIPHCEQANDTIPCGFNCIPK